MSKLEEDVKPTLLSLIRPGDVSLTVGAQTTLAVWAEKTAIVWEFSDQKVPVSTESQRASFAKTLTPSDFTRVWLGGFDGTRQAEPRVVDVYGIQMPRDLIATAPPQGMLPNYRMTTILVGPVVMYVAYAADDRGANYVHSVTDPFYRPLMTQIWPIKREQISWPPYLSLYDAEYLNLLPGIATRGTSAP
jgi:hypothetical protein